MASIPLPLSKKAKSSETQADGMLEDRASSPN